jgi:glycosyltransferase involved in cell wall biosynthesis
MTSPLVSVIIRTQSRPLLLQRALNSVSAQTWANWEVIVVNDGGPDTGYLGDRVKVIHHEKALGRSPAANRGLKEAQGKYAAFLDDDDTWEPTFLSETVGYLETSYHPHLAAAATHATKVIEEVSGNHIVTKKKKAHKPVKTSISLFELAVNNFIPIHSCVFLRRAALEVGGIDEELPLLEDWDFFLRLAERYEIGMIPKPLANYHIRSKCTEKNTVVTNRALCIYCENYIRNKYLRKDISEGRYGLGGLLNMAEATRDLSFWRCVKNDITRLKRKIFG